MKLSDFICFDATIPDLKADDRDGVIAELVAALDSAGEIGNAKPKDVAKAVIKRENEASTGIGKGVAIPHVKHKAIKNVIAAIGCKNEGIDFSSLDKQPAYTIILLLSPAGNADKHLQAIENIFKHLQKDDFRRFLKQAQTVEQIREVIMDASEGAS